MCTVFIALFCHFKNGHFILIKFFLLLLPEVDGSALDCTIPGNDGQWSKHLMGPVWSALVSFDTFSSLHLTTATRQEPYPDVTVSAFCSRAGRCDGTDACPFAAISHPMSRRRRRRCEVPDSGRTIEDANIIVYTDAVAHSRFGDPGGGWDRGLSIFHTRTLRLRVPGDCLERALQTVFKANHVCVALSPTMTMTTTPASGKVEVDSYLRKER